MKSFFNRLALYAGVSTNEILEHLYITSGDITAKDLADNHQKMNTPYDPSQSFENLFDQIDEITELVYAVETLYTVPHTVSIGYNIIQ